MRILQLMAMAAIVAVGVRWAIREGSKPPEEERQLILGYYDDGTPIMSDDDCDVEGTLEMWENMRQKVRSRM